MEMELFEKIVKESKGWCGIFYLFLAGESLMHRQLPEMIRLASDNGIRVVLHTNGCLLTKDKAAALVDSGLHEISFSFDALDAAEYENRRAGANFDKTLENIREFLRIRSEKKSRSPKVTIQSIDFLNSAGTTGKKRLAELFPGISSRDVNIIPPHTWAGTFKDDPTLAAPEKCGEYFPCKFLWSSMAIQWDGEVAACCNDLFGEIHLGNVKRETLREVWNGKPMQRFRGALAASRLSEYPLCADCDVPYNHNNARGPVKFARSLSNRKLAGALALGIEIARRSVAGTRDYLRKFRG